MKTSCATSSRNVMARIQRRTAGEAFERNAGVADLEAAVLEATVRREAADATHTSTTSPASTRERRSATIPVSQISGEKTLRFWRRDVFQIPQFLEKIPPVEDVV